MPEILACQRSPEVKDKLKRTTTGGNAVGWEWQGALCSSGAQGECRSPAIFEACLGQNLESIINNL